MNKEELRQKYLLIRKNIINKQEKSESIANLIINNEIYKKARVIALYKSLSNEVDTTLLITKSIELKKVVLLPRVEGMDLEFHEIKDIHSPLIKSNFGVEEPVKNEITRFNKNLIDLVIVPGVCFDKRGNRLGYGKGYYDRFLMNSNLKCIGICYEEQITDNLLEISSYDVKMDFLVTEKGYIKDEE